MSERIDYHGIYADEPPILTMRVVEHRVHGVYVRDVAYDLRNKADRLAVLKLIAAEQAKDPACQRNLARLFDRSEEGPHTDYLRTLKREQEDRLGRIEALPPEPARPPGPDADGRRETVEGTQGVRPRPDRIVGPEREWIWSC